MGRWQEIIEGEMPSGCRKLRTRQRAVWMHKIAAAWRWVAPPAPGSTHSRRSRLGCRGAYCHIYLASYQVSAYLASTIKSTSSGLGSRPLKGLRMHATTRSRACSAVSRGPSRITSSCTWEEVKWGWVQRAGWGRRM